MRLRIAGTTALDPADRRRVRARLTPRARAAILRRARHSADGAVSAAVGDPETGRRALPLLDELADLPLKG